MVSRTFDGKYHTTKVVTFPQ